MGELVRMFKAPAGRPAKWSDFMIRLLVLLGCLASAAALAQPVGDHTMHHDPLSMMQGSGAGTMDARRPIEAGQSAFAAIQEIVALLEADPATDWSKVDIEALRQHLVDMNNVTLEAKVANVAVDGGMRFDVTGEGPVSDLIRRMVAAHAATMNGVDGWTFEAKQIEGGASLFVRAPPKDAARLKGLGFFGVMTLGMHHQAHHLMIARGQNLRE